MAAPIKSFGEFFSEYDGMTRRPQPGLRPQTGGPLTLEQRPRAGSFANRMPSGFESPETPPRPPTPTFDRTTGREVPQKAPPLVQEPETRPSASASEAYGAPTQPAPQPTADWQPAAQGSAFASSGSSGKAPSMYGYKAPQSSQDFWNQIFAPVTGGIESGYQQLGGAVGGFREAAGDLRTLEDLGGEEALLRAAETGDPEAMAAARAAIGADYTGPAGLDPETLAALQREFQDIAPYAKNLSSVAGVQALLEEARPGLSSGARRTEAQRLLESPEFRELTRTLGRDIGALGGTTERERIAAEDFAREREASEAEIARLARQTLEGRRGTIDEDLERRITEANAREQAAAEAYDYFTKTGDASRLQALDLGFDPSMFETELTALDREAQTAREAIVNDPRYEKIKDIPLMTLGITSHGSRRYEWDPEWWEANKDALLAEYGKKGVGKLKALARARQKELKEGGFDIGGRGREAGKYAGAENIYGEDLFDPQEGWKSYVGYDPGNVATRSNIASEAQRGEYNRIQDLLGQVDTLRDTDPYEAARIESDLEGWATAQREQYEAAREQLEALGYEFDTAAKQQRKSYKKAKKKETAGYVGLGVGAVLGTLIGNPVLGAAVGQQIGASTV